MILNLLRKPEIVVAINMFPPRGPWGGAGFFVKQLENGLKERGIGVQYHLRGKVDLIVLIDPREDLENKAFGLAEILQYKRQNPNTRVLHRINECDARKATSFMDELLAEANKVADFTVFISNWLRDYHVGHWFDIKKPHSVIYNGANPRIFNPLFRKPYSSNSPLRLVTHHWSDNMLKGFDEYRLLDELIAGDKLKNTELWVIGRWPDSIKWKRAKTFPPETGKNLAGLLKQCNVYITASRWEPCGMHHVEGAQCGLPLIYHQDGGGIIEAGLNYGIGFKNDLIPAIEEMKESYNHYIEQVLMKMPCGDLMKLSFIHLIQAMLCLPQDDKEN